MKFLFHFLQERGNAEDHGYLSNTWDEYGVIRNLMSCWR